MLEVGVVIEAGAGAILPVVTTEVENIHLLMEALMGEDVDHLTRADTIPARVEVAITDVISRFD